MRFILLLGLLSLAPGCVLHARGYYPRPAPQPVPAPQPPPPSGPRAMSYDEAVSLGLSQCHSRGYRCELKEAHLTGKDVWKVKFHAWASGNARGHLHLDYNAWSRALLKVDDKMKARKDDDWDDDGRDDGRGHGRGKKKGHAKWDD
jgi:hypothetical protein